MRAIKTVSGIPNGRHQITEVQREVLGRMIDAGIFSYADLARYLGIKPWTLSKSLRGRRANPHVLKKILAFLGKDPTEGRETGDRRPGRLTEDRRPEPRSPERLSGKKVA